MGTIKMRAYLGVNEPEAVSSLLFRQAFLYEILNNLLGNTNTSRSSTHKYSTLVLDLNAGFLQTIDNSGQDNGASALNVIIEAGILVLILL